MNRAEKGFIRAVQDPKDLSIKYFNAPRFNGVSSRVLLFTTRDGEYVINLDEHPDVGTH